MSKIMVISFLERTDSYEIADKISESIPMEIGLENTYAEMKEGSLSVNSLDGDTLDALKKVMDACTAVFETGAFEFIVKKDVKGFSLTDSFIRDTVDIIKPLTPIADGTPLMARFEIPGFGNNSYRDITLYYNESFDPADITLLAEIGITLSGDGAEFSIANITDCRVSFFRPESATEPYIIDYSETNEIIEP